MKRMYLQVSGGQFYESSKTVKKGFEQHVVEDDNGTMVKKGYRKYFQSVTGILYKVDNFEASEKNKFAQVQIIIQDLSKKGFFYISLGREYQNGQFNPNLSSILAQLKTINIGDTIKLTPYYMTKDQNGKDLKRANQGISLQVADTPLDKSTLRKLEADEKYTWERNTYNEKTKAFDILIEGDIPMINWTTKTVRGVEKNKADTEEQSNYLFDILMKFCDDSADAKVPYIGGSSEASFDDDDGDEPQGSEDQPDDDDEEAFVEEDESEEEEEASAPPKARSRATTSEPKKTIEAPAKKSSNPFARKG